MAVTGINHITLAVSKLGTSFDFYTDVLGFAPVARWSKGAYLTAGDLWLALVLGDVSQALSDSDYSHIAFSCDKGEFKALVEGLRSAGYGAWQEHRSEGDSYYFHDPDGHKLEVHVGDLASRVADMEQVPWDEFEYF